MKCWVYWFDPGHKPFPALYCVDRDVLAKLASRAITWTADLPLGDRYELTAAFLATAPESPKPREE